jgi:hypothetical protein
VRRRTFIAGLAGAAAWPLVARGQQVDRTRRVGALLAYQEGDELAQARIAAFRRGLQQLGWHQRQMARAAQRYCARRDTNCRHLQSSESSLARPHALD